MVMVTMMGMIMMMVVVFLRVALMLVLVWPSSCLLLDAPIAS